MLSTMSCFEPAPGNWALEVGTSGETAVEWTFQLAVIGGEMSAAGVASAVEGGEIDVSAS
jgi:hypothetical protein